MLVQIIPGDILEETSAALDDYAKEHLDDDNGNNGVKREEDSKLKMAEIINKTVEATMDNNKKGGRTMRNGESAALKHFVRSPEDRFDFGSEMEPVKSFVVEETRLLYPGAKHTWLCDGKVSLLSRLMDDLNSFLMLWSNWI